MKGKWEIMSENYRKMEVYPLVNVYIHHKLERSSIFWGDNSILPWAIFNSHVTNYQKVYEKIRDSSNWKYYIL